MMSPSEINEIQVQLIVDIEEKIHEEAKNFERKFYHAPKAVILGPLEYLSLCVYFSTARHGSPQPNYRVTEYYGMIVVPCLTKGISFGVEPELVPSLVGATEEKGSEAAYREYLEKLKGRSHEIVTYECRPDCVLDGRLNPRVFLLRSGRSRNCARRPWFGMCAVKSDAKEKKIDAEATKTLRRMTKAMDTLYSSKLFVTESERYQLANALELLRDKTADAYGAALGKAAAWRYKYRVR
jgi:hypothetical protein